jgi:hypothetical protein
LASDSHSGASLPSSSAARLKRGKPRPKSRLASRVVGDAVDDEILHRHQLHPFIDWHFLHVLLHPRCPLLWRGRASRSCVSRLVPGNEDTVVFSAPLRIDSRAARSLSQTPAR